MAFSGDGREEDWAPWQPGEGAVHRLVFIRPWSERDGELLTLEFTHIRPAGLNS